MQTFLPYESFEESARVLDKRRLNKQRIEAWQIFQALVNPQYGWQRHPAVNMWRGYEKWLLVYGLTMCEEWLRIGGNDYAKLLEKFQEELTDQISQEKPRWLGDKVFHYSHQSNLVRKNPTFYRQFFPDVPDNLPYFWP